VSSKRRAPATLLPGKRAGTPCTGGWMGPRVGPDGCGKSHSHRKFNNIYWILWAVWPASYLVYFLTASVPLAQQLHLHIGTVTYWRIENSTLQYTNNCIVFIPKVPSNYTMQQILLLPLCLDHRWGRVSLLACLVARPDRQGDDFYFPIRLHIAYFWKHKNDARSGALDD
jgi:hypothetical protein